MNAIPERLRERAIRVMQELHTCLAPAHQECDSAQEAIATALHEIEQAAEQRGAERMREAAAVAVHQRLHPSNPVHDWTDFAQQQAASARAAVAVVLALPTTAEPAKGA